MKTPKRIFPSHSPGFHERESLALSCREKSILLHWGSLWAFAPLPTPILRARCHLRGISRLTIAPRLIGSRSTRIRRRFSGEPISIDTRVCIHAHVGFYFNLIESFCSRRTSNPVYRETTMWVSLDVRDDNGSINVCFARTLGNYWHRGRLLSSMSLQRVNEFNDAQAIGSRTFVRSKFNFQIQEGLTDSTDFYDSYIPIMEMNFCQKVTSNYIYIRICRRTRKGNTRERHPVARHMPPSFAPFARIGTSVMSAFA